VAPGRFPRHPFHGRLANAVHAIRIGPSATDLHVDFPFDPSANLMAELPKEAATLLSKGHQELHVLIRLSTGQALGPKELYTVKPHGRKGEMVCD